MLMDNRHALCSFPLKAAEGRKITTIEGLPDSDKVVQAVHKAWVDNFVPQCGYCQSGQVMTTVALLKEIQNLPTRKLTPL